MLENTIAFVKQSAKPEMMHCYLARAGSCEGLRGFVSFVSRLDVCKFISRLNFATTKVCRNILDVELVKSSHTQETHTAL